jgi:predicted dehydrogenase
VSVQLALVGAGLVGRRHAAAIAECEGVSLAAVADPGEAGRSCAAAAGAPWYRSLAEMFSECAPDGAILATPNNVHLENGLECVRAGCPMLVEKPLAISAAEGGVLVEAAAAADVPVLVGHHRRHNPLVQKARDVIDAGKLGRLRAVHASCWLYKPDDYFDRAAWRKEKGAGPVSVNLVHDVDLMRYFCGDVESVQAQTAPAARGYANEDAAAVILRFAGGALGTLTVADAVVSPWSWELTAGENPVYPDTGQSCYFLGGSHGALSLPDLTLWENNGVRSWWQPLRMSVLDCEAVEPLVKQIRQFAAVIAGAAEPLVSGAEAVKTLQVIEAIHRSAASGEIVRPQAVAAK